MYHRAIFESRFNFFYLRQGLALLPGLGYNGMIIAHCSLDLFASRNSPSPTLSTKICSSRPWLTDTTTHQLLKAEIWALFDFFLYFQKFNSLANPINSTSNKDLKSVFSPFECYRLPLHKPSYHLSLT